MKTVAEIRENIEDIKYQLSKMEKPKTYYDETWDTQLAEMEAWINALEWVIEDKPKETNNEEVHDNKNP